MYVRMSLQDTNDANAGVACVQGKDLQMVV